MPPASRGEHPVGRPLHRAAADERADRDAGNAAPLERGADLGDGEDRADRHVRVARARSTIRSAARSPRDARRGPGLARPRCSGRRRPRRDGPRATNHSWNGNVPPASRRRCAAGRRSRGAAGSEAERLGEPRGDLGERHALAQQLRAHEMQPEVAVAEPEPGFAAELRHRRERVPGLVRAAPAALLVGDAGEGVEHAVEVGGDVQAEHLDVVPHVAYDGYVVRFDDSDHSAQEPRAADTAREHGHLHAAAPARSEARTLRVRGPSRPLEPLEIGDRVHVIYEIRRVHLQEGAERREPRRAAGPVDRDEQAGRGRARARSSSRRPRGASASPSSGTAPASASRSRAVRTGRSALTTRNGPTPARSQRRCLEPCADGGPLAAAGVRHERRVARTTVSGGPTTNVGPTAVHAARHVAEHRGGEHRPGAAG